MFNKDLPSYIQCDGSVSVMPYVGTSLVIKSPYFTSCDLISRFLLKSLLQYQSLSEGEMLPTLSSSSHPPVPAVALASGSAGASGLSGAHNLASVVSTGEEGPLKKPKKERKERGRENGKDERECSGEHMNLNS